MHLPPRQLESYFAISGRCFVSLARGYLWYGSRVGMVLVHGSGHRPTYPFRQRFVEWKVGLCRRCFLQDFACVSDGGSRHDFEGPLAK